ncbi:Uncharacterised protein [uncultured archaeon]|nr:Uncharacterised protein [uncultured archaeon]
MQVESIYFYCFYSEKLYFTVQLKSCMRNEIVGVILLFVISLYSAASVSWYSPSANLPAAVFAVFPVMGAAGVVFLAYKKKVI